MNSNNNQPNEYLIKKLYTLIEKYKSGELGGEFMPEDSNPHLEMSSKENYLFFTLPMALNYQRNSYKLWESACQSYNDIETRDIFDPNKVISMPIETLRDKLLKYNVALQPNKQPLIWLRLCETFSNNYSGDVRLLFSSNDYRVHKIKQHMIDNKKNFPYLSGEKIMNYWLYVMNNYTSLKLLDRENISIAPDTHVLQASIKLGIIEQTDLKRNDIREYTSNCWKCLCEYTDLLPIDLHTPLWLWSRNNFQCKL